MFKAVKEPYKKKNNEYEGKVDSLKIKTEVKSVVPFSRLTQYDSSDDKLTIRKGQDMIAVMTTTKRKMLVEVEKGMMKTTRNIHPMMHTTNFFAIPTIAFKEKSHS